MSPVPTIEVRSERSQEWDALHGHRALTPIISGAISGGLVGVAWIIGFIVYFYKRHRRERRAIAAGYRGHREMPPPPKKPQAFIIPPDPAIVQGQLEPGNIAGDSTGSIAMKQIYSIPLSNREKHILAESQKTTPTKTTPAGTTPTDTSPDLAHNMPESSRLIRNGRAPPIHSTTTIHDRYAQDLANHADLV